MYIGSTYLYLDIIDYNNKAPASWITSERYENCENFYQHLVVKQDRPKLFHRKSDANTKMK